MDGSTPAQIFFELIDREIDSCAERMRGRVFSSYRDFPWTPEQRKLLQPLLRKELEYLFQHFLGACDNVGSVLPEGVLGYTISSQTIVGEEDLSYPDITVDPTEDGYIEGGIRIGGADYIDMWRAYLRDKEQHVPATSSKTD